jgi:hypothetical protein
MEAEMDPAIMAYVGLAKAAMRGGTVLWKPHRAHALSTYETTLLLASAESGEFVLSTAGERALPIVSVGARTFADDGDPVVAAHYRDGFRSLIRRGYVEYVADARFTLTGDGFDKARSLKP